MDYVFRRALSIALTISLALTPSFGWGLRIQLNTNYNVRTSQITHVMGSLKAGSIIEIPDQYAVDKSGNPLFNDQGQRIREGAADFERTLNNWIDKSATLHRNTKPDIYTFGQKASGAPKSDWFFPVKIVEAKSGSSFDPSKVGDNQTTWIALKHLSRNNNGIILSENTDVQVEQNPGTDTPTVESPEFFYLKTKRRIPARRFDATYDNQMEYVAAVNPGSILRIDGSYAIRDSDGRINLAATLDNWTSSSGNAEETTAGKYLYEGDQEAYFYPAQVYHYHGDRQDLIAQNAENLLFGLRAFANSGAYEIISEEAAQQFASGEPVDSTETVPAVDNPGDPLSSDNPSEEVPDDASHGEDDDGDDSVTEAQAPCESCDVPDPLAAMAHKLPVTLRRLAERISKIQGDQEIFRGRMSRNFRSTCGFEWSQFENYMKTELAENNISFELLKELMLHESGGAKCMAMYSEDNRSRSVGLFQVNTGSSKYDRCNTNQRNRIKQLAGDIRAADDLKEFNRHNGTALNPNKWNDLRLFFFRRALNNSEQRQFFGRRRTNGMRSWNNSLRNVAYVESLIPRTIESN